MSPVWEKRLSNLLCVKSICDPYAVWSVALLFPVLGQISGQDFLTIFSVVIAFYFGTQSQKNGTENRCQT